MKYVLSHVVLTLAMCPFVCAYDFAELTSLASGALLGENVAAPVSGFDIRLLQHGELIYHQSFGDWSLNRVAAVDSSTKTLSGALIMALAENTQYGFSLDSHLGMFLSEYNEGDLSDITIRQAFSHASGIAGDESSPGILSNPLITLRHSARLIARNPLAYGPPGSAFSYGGLSMQAAGAAAEVAAGGRWIDLFAERIATPLNMSNTSFYIASDLNPRIAGGARSTASDFSTFMDMLLNDGVDRQSGIRILAQESVDEMLTRQTTDDQPIINSPSDNNRYGIGVWLDQLAETGQPVDALAAGARGFHSWIDQSHGLVFTFATDRSQFANVEHLSALMHASILAAVSPAGDFDYDGDVDGRDFLAWQRNPNVGNLGDWQENYGSASLGAATNPFPEPQTALLLVLGGMVLSAGKRPTRTTAGVIPSR
ncbi:serine hydrolase domain-containing protein [Bythopirellula polymerisocia]|nr:serine hydrolase [Bythopirellula polymerisocia]